MAQRASDESVLGKIENLVHEEQHLYGQEELSDHDQVRLEKIQVELDQCWDLLRQRRARREFGQDPDDAKVRPRAGRRALQTVDVNPPTLVMNSPAATGGKLNAIEHILTTLNGRLISWAIEAVNTPRLVTVPSRDSSGLCQSGHR